MDPLAVAQGLVEVGIIIHRIAMTVKENRSAYAALAHRCKTCTETVRGLVLENEKRREVDINDSVDLSAPAAASPLRQLRELLEEIKDAVEKAAKRNFLKQLVFFLRWEQEIKDHHERLQQLQQDVQLALFRDLARDNRKAWERLEREQRKVERRMAENHKELLEALDKDRKRTFESAMDLPMAKVLEVKDLDDLVKTLVDVEKTAEDAEYRTAIKMSRRVVNQVRMVKKTAITVDLAFLVDCTGSMVEFLDYTKKVIENILDALTEHFPQLTLKVAFVGYRDFDKNGKSEYEVADFAPPADTRRRIASVKCRGGCGSDWPEDLLGGLDRASKLSWSSPARVLVHIADAPPHGKMFFDRGRHNDRYYDDDEPDPNGMRPDSYRGVLETLKQRGVEYYFFPLNDTTKETETLFKGASKAMGLPFEVVKLDAEGKEHPDYKALLAGIVQRTAGSIVHSFAHMVLGDGAGKRSPMSPVSPASPIIR
ncbi:hypothetical protein DFJ74DRAFT_650180 [Hyaloraphidium curvatum]|nr:hypothetical protein DFJ74DRAFT_650180 [Hyaloraphidium curvatum]